MALEEQRVHRFNHVIRDYFLQAANAQGHRVSFSPVGFLLGRVNPGTPDIEFGFERTDPASNITARGRMWARYNGDGTMTVEFAYPDGIAPPDTEDPRFDVEAFLLEDAHQLVQSWLDHSFSKA